MVHSKQSLWAWRKDWSNWKSVGESKSSRLLYCWDRPEYREESWRSEKTCYHSEFIERRSTNAGIKKIARSKVVIDIKIRLYIKIVINMKNNIRYKNNNRLKETLENNKSKITELINEESKN